VLLDKASCGSGFSSNSSFICGLIKLLADLARRGWSSCSLLHHSRARCSSTLISPSEGRPLSCFVKYCIWLLIKSLSGAVGNLGVLKIRQLISLLICSKALISSYKRLFCVMLSPKLSFRYSSSTLLSFGFAWSQMDNVVSKGGDGGGALCWGRPCRRWSFQLQLLSWLFLLEIESPSSLSNSSMILLIITICSYFYNKGPM